MPKPTRYGYLTYGEPSFAGNESKLGGVVLPFVNGIVTTLKIGDVVLMSGNGIVDKVDASASTLFKGVVVAGAQTDFRIPEGLSVAQIQSGINAGLINETVYVLVDGIFWVVASGVVAVGASIIGSATAGRVQSGTTAGCGLGWNIGAASVNAGDVLLAYIKPSNS